MAADPWAEFRSPDANAAALIRNDVPPATSRRTEVAPSRRVWGDQEAEAAGLYESPAAGDPWAAFRMPAQPQQVSTAPQPQMREASVDDRFGEFQTPENEAALRSGLTQRAGEMTTGPQLSPPAQLAISQRNLLSGAQQGTSPHASQYQGRLVSKETFEGDSGDLMFRDPATGQVVPTDKSRHVALRDPADGVIKVYDRSQETDEGGLTGAARVLSPGLASGAATARPAIPDATKVVPRASEIFATAKEPYRRFDAIAGKIEMPAETASGFVQRIQQALEKAKVPRHLAEEVYKSVEIIANGSKNTLDHLRDVKELIGQSSRSADGRVRQAAGVANREIVKIISEVSTEAGASLKQADAIHSTARSVQDLQRKGDIANLRTSRSGYGGNAVNNMRTQIEKIVEAHVMGKQTGFKPDEIQAMREIVEGNWLTNSLRGLGAMSPSKGVMQIGLGTMTGGLTAALGAGANKLATILTGKQLDRLNELVAKRSPEYAKAVSKATERYERAQMELVNNPSPAKFSAYLSASRALSSGLQRDGVQVTAGDLIRQLQGPMKAAAGDEQPESEGRIDQ